MSSPRLPQSRTALRGSSLSRTGGPIVEVIASRRFARSSRTPISACSQAINIASSALVTSSSMSRSRVTSLELYDDAHSEFSSKVKVALYAKRLAWTSLAVPCGTTRSPEFLAINPLGKIPVLIVTTEDGRREVVFESEVILEYLEEQFPEPPLLPADPLDRSKARLISRFHDLYLEPALRRLYPQVAPSVRSEAVVQEAAAAFRARLQELEGLLPPDRTLAVTDDRLSLADCAYPALLLYAEMILPAVGQPGAIGYEGLPRLRRWREALWGQEAVRAMLAELTPAAEEWLERKLRS